MKKHLPIILLFTAIAICGAYLEGMGAFKDMVKGLRSRELPSVYLNFGRRGQIFKKMGLTYIVPLDNQYTDEGESRITLDLSKLESRDEWIQADKLPPQNMKSTTIINKKLVATGLPILSLYMNEHDLYDTFTGIYANPLERGRNWERPCFISYFNNGALLFGTGAGVRIHGETSRLHAVKNFRIYLRDVYGKEYFGQNILFNGKGDPVQRFVIKKIENDYGFTVAMAYAIARKMGCYAPLADPVKFYLNGKPHGSGNFVLLEYLDMHYLQNHFGHKNFVYYELKGKKDKPREYQRLYEWAKFEGKSITFEKTSELIDMENFINYWIVNIFCSNSDPYQGVALLDTTKKNPRWFWLMWDMDHAFRNIYEHDKKNLWEQERPINLVYTNTKKETDPRYFIFRKLIFHDEQFRAVFKKKLTHALNYILTADYLASIVDKNSKVALSFGMDIKKGHGELTEYMQKRPKYVMKMMNRYFKLGDVYMVHFTIPSGKGVIIDGFEVTKSFTGYYFKGAEISVSAINGKGLIINGKHNAVSTSFRVTNDMTVQCL